MSTRCQLAVYENENDEIESAKCFLYRHSDGYPDGEHGVVDQILPFLEQFNKDRGLGDTSYALARLTGHLTNLHPGVTGYGIDEMLHGDIEYFYHISPKLLKVIKVTLTSSYQVKSPKNWEVVETHIICKVPQTA